MIISVSLGIYEIAFFHLVRHALFKSLLFLCAGFFIHSNGNWQDSRCLSGLNFNSPIISFYFYCASASLCGFPFLTGFYSKDLILEIYYMGEMNYFIFFIIFVSTIFTLFYSVRLISFLFLISSNSGVMSLGGEDTLIYLSIYVLFISSVFMGSIFSWVYFPCFFISLRLIIKVFIIIFLIFSFLISYNLGGVYYNKKIIYLSSFMYFIKVMWNLPFIRVVYLRASLKMGGIYSKHLDQSWLEYIGAQGSYRNFVQFGYLFDKFNLLNIKSYLIIFIYFLVIILLLL